eukprot:GFUD01029377.1.p1 GENE.GFUD01029377.1~~GFUD01029377.1.p1  ORF type:complete len:2023 (+),score=566.09 GFUD01029377.1:57-6125(+)
MFGAGSNPFGPKTSKRKTPPVGGTPVGLFGMPAPSPIGSTVSTQSGFAGFGGSNPGPSSSGGFSNQLFGNSGSPGFGGSVPVPQFGQAPTTTNSSLFSQGMATSTIAPPIFGSNPTTETKAGLFSQVPTTSPVFGQPLVQAVTVAPPLFGKLLDSSPTSTTAATFGSNPPASTPAIFGDSSVVRSASTRPNTPVFGESVAPDISTSVPSSLFGAPSSSAAATPLFGAPAASTISSASLFGAPQASSTTASLFGGTLSTGTATSLFGAPPSQTTTSSLFGGPPSSTATATSLFGGTPTTTTMPAIFGATSVSEDSRSNKSSKLGATAKFLMQSSVGTAGLFEANQSLKAPLFGAKAEADTEKPGVFSENSSAENLFGLQQQSSEQSIFRPTLESDTPAFFSSNDPSVFSAPIGKSKPSIKSRLGAVGEANTSSQETVFSKPKLVRTAMFGKSVPPPDMDVKKSDERDLSETESEVSDGGTRKPRMERTVSKEELSNITSILCEVVPDVINKNVILTKHFSKFGEVTRVYANLKKKTATIHFKDHKSAKLAKSKGKMVNPALPPIGHIFYSQSSPGSKSKARLQRSSSRADLDAELVAMGGTGAGNPLDMERPKPLPKKKIFSITKALNAPPSTEGGPEMSSLADEPPSRVQGASELLAVMKQQTFSDGDRWSVLEARDKYIRLKMPKKQIRFGQEIEDVNLVGTCPDFCPEKERYGRSAKNQLRWFEKDCGKLNHLAAVKEHSRSAADQDVPLSHELRPPTVLSKTMDFLMCNIVDRIDNMVGTMSDWFQFIDQLSLQNLLPSDPMSQFYVVNTEYTGESVGDWFEFMWSITRAIRKDITQQNSHDLVSLSIVEKCARFHIFCAERLCEEDAHNFDRKLNDENLTKCLRTLKHMYYDLSLEGIVCPREKEFRAYDVLMNLNEGDTLREVQTLSVELRTDPRVLFSLRCLTALENNNYVLFFKLVKQASYLEACILKRYFYQVRRKALETIQRAFTPGKGMVNFPTQKIVDLLGFESISECGNFIRIHGIEYEDDTVFLERNTFVYPDTAPPMYRSIILIGSKKCVSFGEVMNGGPLSDNPYLDYFPHDSFDDNGFLKMDAYEARDQEVTVSPEELEKIQRAEELKKQQAEFAMEMVKQITQEFCVLEAELICENVLMEAKNEKIAVEFVEILEKECVNELIDGVVLDTLRNARNELIAKKMLENQKAEEEAEACYEVVMDWVDGMVDEVGREEMLEVVRNRKLQKYLVLAEKVAEELIEETIGEDVGSIAVTALLEAEREKQEKIKLLRKRLQRKQIKKVFTEWRRLASKSARQKAAVQNFPAGPADLTSEEQNSRLGWSRENVQQRHISLGSLLQGRKELDLMIRAKEMEESLIHNAVLEPFHLLEWLKTAVSSVQDSFKWKLILSLPEVEDDSSSRPFMEMLKRKFRKSLSGSKDEDLLVCQTVPHSGTAISVCVREVGEATLESITYSEKERKKVFGGTSAIMFVFIDLEETIEKSRARLEAVLVNRPRIPAVPLTVLSNTELSETSNMFDLARYLSEGLISSYDVFCVSCDIFDITNSVRLNEAVKQLINKVPADPVKMLSMKPLNDYIEDFLSSYVFTEFYSNLKDRRSRDLLDRPASDLIALYNSALDHLIDVAMDLSLQEISWPAQEFVGQGLELESEVPDNWNDSQYINSLVSVMEELKLPEMEVLETNTWKNLVEQVLVYLDKIAVPGVDSSVVASNMTRSLARCYRTFLSRCSSQWGGVESVPPPEVLPWTDLVHSCIQYKLATVDSLESICYKDDALAAFSLPAEWLAGLGWGGEHLMESMQEVVDTTISEARERSMVEQGESCINSELRETLKKEQNQSVRFERMLEEALIDDCIPSRTAVSGSIGHNKTLDTEDTEENISENSEDSADLRTTQFVPIISYVSPTLGRLVSPYHMLTRREVPRTGQSPRYSRDNKQFPITPSGPVITSKRKAELSQGSNKKSIMSKRLSLSPDSRPLRMDLDQKLDTLKVGLNNDIEQDLMFERRLQAALN